ncbi:hypothetical protein RC96_19400 [Pectobacterium carotovorum subsp. carotovorum]|nr:hypothetical protein RC96_19400 [Pectobacterium carotovorum subsp. carotovorum]MBD0848733.1 hypothetical protein [Pectobacterium carotovorum subsp. carotovorum]PWD65014.1 hypothetical protein DF215_21980 [Pectobacterium versatile]
MISSRSWILICGKKSSSQMQIFRKGIGKLTDSHSVSPYNVEVSPCLVLQYLSGAKLVFRWSFVKYVPDCLQFKARIGTSQLLSLILWLKQAIRGFSNLSPLFKLKRPDHIVAVSIQKIRSIMITSILCTRQSLNIG